MFGKETYVQRRALLKKKLGSGVLLFLGNDDYGLNYESNTFRYRQDSTFLYYFGLPFAGLSAIIDIDDDKEIIFGTAKEGLVALDNQTLEEKWKCPVGDALIYTSPYSRPVSGTIETTPVLAGKMIAVGASDGTIYGVDKATGKITWKHATGSPVFGSVAASGNALVATDFGGNVYVFTRK